MVDKGLGLICPDAQATYAITVGTRGHTTRKVGQVTNRKNRRTYCVSHILFLNFSLSSQSLSAKDHIVNINIRYRDLVLLALIVSLLLFP